MVERFWNESSVRKACEWEERWRFKHRKTDDVVKPRQIVVDYLLTPFIDPYCDAADFLDEDITVESSFDASMPCGRYFGTLELIHDFVDLPTSELLCDWRVVLAGEWKYDEVIHVTEARSILIAARRICRSRRNLFKTHLIC